MHSATATGRQPTPASPSGNIPPQPACQHPLTPQQWFALLDTGSMTEIEQALADQPQLVALRDDHDMTALARALERGQDALAAMLVCCGATVSTPIRRQDAGPLMDLTRAAHALSTRDASSVDALTRSVANLQRDAPLAGLDEMSLAVRSGNTQIIGALVQRDGPQIMSRHDGLGCTALTRAIQDSATTRQSHTVVAELLRLGADPSAPDARDRTPLMHAAWAGDGALADQLIAHGATLGLPASDGATPLSLAALAGHDELVSTLVCAMRADPAFDDARLHEQGFHALQVALRAGQAACASRLFECGFASGLQPRQAGALLALAADSGSPTAFEAAWQHLGSAIRTDRAHRAQALGLACACGSLEVARELVGARAGVDRAPRGAAPPLVRACAAGHLDVARFLVSKGASINLGGPAGAPLVVAAAHGHTAVVQWLLTQVKADNSPGSSSATALCAAAAGAGTDVIDLLLAHGVPIDQTDPAGYTPLGAAAAAGNTTTVRHLLERGADFRIGPPRAMSVLVCAATAGHAALLDELLALYPDPQERDLAVESALQDVLRTGDVDALRLLLDSMAARALPRAYLTALEGWARLSVTAGTVERTVYRALVNLLHTPDDRRERT